MAQNRSTLRPRKQRWEEPALQVELPAAVHSKRIPIWGGVECTRNRVGTDYYDQAELSGHLQRPRDYEQIAGLGIRTMRVAMLWEHYHRDQSWRAIDLSMIALRELKIRPIAGLMHHGSGPSHTNLTDPALPGELAAYAGALAERYPDIDAYTPVNEPNTTARFSGQYGFWYPHHRSTGSYLRALLSQVKATVLSMRAIRRVRQDAQLIQTDDCGEITGTPELRSTAELLNTRQWLTFDLLFGRVDRYHPMFEYILSHGINEHDVLWFRDNPCPPEVIGVNYYATSDRYLDHRHWLYPDGMGSSEGNFIDVEAVRVEGCGAVSFSRPIAEAWRRYRRPIALTEVHLGGAAAEQIRWLSDAYASMEHARRNGVPCAGLTVWALLGSYFWNELVTRDNGYYEPGAFDVRSGQPVATALAEFTRQLAQGSPIAHSALDESGWWTRTDRACYPWADGSSTKAA